MSAVRMPEGKLYEDRYHIWDPAFVEYKERTKFLQSVEGEYTCQEALEDILACVRVPVLVDNIPLATIAARYKELRGYNARLPKFTRWVTSLFPGNAKIATELAKRGQAAAKREIVISGTLVDLLRSGYSPHFSSCLGFRYQSTTPEASKWQGYPVRIAEEWPGIAIAYTQDKDKQFTARQFLAHGRTKQGEDVVVAQGNYAPSNGLSVKNIATALASKKVRVFQRSYDTVMGESLTFVDCPTTTMHFDIPTWDKTALYQEVK